MARFTTSQESAAVVAASREDVWAVLTDPELLTRLTPFLKRIDADGDVWRWQMSPIPALGVTFVPAFTEKMSFDEPRRIDFVHAPPSGTRERSGVDGWYRLEEVDGGTSLATRLEIEVDLPLSRLAKPAVTRVMDGVLGPMGSRFASNLCDHLGIPRPRG
ncbi:CoxG family protein [Solicola sp. PLA-1-18]|uniref:CoxG family protein n=1 Tax=Solicola sp. PLA-1-18 TaxID=3380532 RepID=UPI003B7A38D3